MTTNQTIDGVPRAALMTVLSEPRPDASHCVLEARAALCALLDAEECCHEFVPFQANCTKCGIPYKPAAQPQGVPVAWLGSGVPFARQQDAIEYASYKDKQVTALYAEQPAPVAVVLPERAPGDTEDSDVLSDCRNEGWNACLDELKRLNPSL